MPAILVGTSNVSQTQQSNDTTASDQKSIRPTPEIRNITSGTYPAFLTLMFSVQKSILIHKNLSKPKTELVSQAVNLK
jgi:hypothetical protein